MEINSKFSRIILLFKIFRIRPKNEVNFKNRKVWKVVHTLNYMLFLVVLLTLALTAQDKSESMFTVLIFFAATVASVKLMYLILKNEEILSFLSDSHVDTSNLGNAEKIEVNKKERIFMKLTNAYLLLIELSLIGFIGSTLPIFTVDRKLPFYIDFSLESKYENCVSWILHVFMSWSTFLTAIYNFLTVIVWYILYNYAMQYTLLGKQLKNLGANSCFLQDLISIVKIIRNLYEKVEQFKSFFHNLFLVQITLSAISISISVFVVAFNSTVNLIETGTYVAAFIHVMSDISVVMYLANEIKLVSSRLAYCLFECNWVGQSERSKKCLIIVCEFLKQPQELIIFKLYPMDLKTFTRILNSAYSTFNILQSLR